ncbi:hypothetical protein M2103_000871 [Ereboglobus sp. PH5-5]|nr:hypothetical protein [Ereboglobus sp. PH5-5]
MLIKEKRDGQLLFITFTYSLRSGLFRCAAQRHLRTSCSVGYNPSYFETSESKLACSN